MNGTVVVVVYVVGSFILGVAWGVWVAERALEIFEKETNPPSVRSQSEVGGLILDPISFLLTGASEHELLFLEKLAEGIENSKLSNVRVTKGKVEFNGKIQQAVFVDRSFSTGFVITSVEYGSKDLQFSWWQYDKPRKNIERIGNLTSWWALGCIPFSTFVAPLLLGAIIGSRSVVGNLNFRVQYKLAFEPVPEIEIMSLRTKVEMAIREAVDAVGLGADALVPLTTGVGASLSGRV